MDRTATALWAGRLLDLTTYAAAVTATWGVAVGLVGAAVGMGFLGGVGGGLFVLGWIAFGYGTLTMRPTAPWKHGDAGPTRGAGRGATERPGLRSQFDLSLGGSSDDEETSFQWVVQRLPPARFVPLDPDDRLPTSVRIFVASLAMLGTSFAADVLRYGVRWLA